MTKRTPITYSALEDYYRDTESRYSGGLENSVHFERCVILSFREKSNVVNVLMDNGLVVENVKIITPIKLLLLLLGDVTELKNIPAVIMYKVIPSDGFVQVGDISSLEYSESETQVSKPFYF